MSEIRWALTVTKGRTPGASFPLEPGETIVGSAPPEGRRIGLADQESGTRRMAERQAAFEIRPGEVTVRDLDSPAGTFVNRRRVLPGLALPLAEGDLIDLAGVQLRVSKANGQVEPTTSKVSAFEPFRIAGMACRTWDDFLTLSAQHWDGMVAEVESGRLSAYLLKSGQPPLPAASTSAERLDAWLAALPTSRPCRPELDVHPTSITCRLEPGTSIRRELTLSNLGYRLLRGRVEPPGVAWIRLSSAGFVVSDSSPLAFEVSRPEGSGLPLVGELKITSDGGEARIAIRVEGPAANSTSPSVRPSAIATRLARLSKPGLILAASGLGLGLRLLLGMGWALIGPIGGLGGPAILGILVGLFGGIATALRRREPSLIAPGGLTGSILGLIAASLAVAIARVLEAPLAWGGLTLALAAWMALGAGCGWLMSGRILARGGTES